MSAWQILLITYAIGAPLTALHMRWVIAHGVEEDPEKRRLTAQTEDMTGLSRAGLVVSIGLIWPLILVGYVLQLIMRRPL